MIRFPNCKINLGLSVLNKRPDGFHNIETVFYPIAIKDALEIVSSDNNKDGIHFSQSGIELDDVSDNLCVKAWKILKQDFPHLPAVNMHLHKAIPVGAGLGGGSADAAFTLQLLNDKYHLQLTTDTLLAYALQLGSDCPFFIYNQPMLAHGRGEILNPVSLDLSAYRILIVHPAIHINTAWAFKNLPLSSLKKEKNIAKIIRQPVSTWRDLLMNDFEAVIFKEYPTIAAIKDTLYANDAVYASMSGSGSTVYGIFNASTSQTISLNFPDHYFVKWI